MSHIVKLEQFEGPLDLLLQLIEQEELDISAISLARVCEEYLARLKLMSDRPPEELADFLVIAAKLLFLKSLLLVPGTAAPAEDTTGLTEQLRLYREFLEASREIEQEWRRGAILYAAESVPVSAPTFFPPPRLGIEHLREAFFKIISELEPIVRIPRAVIGRIISIDDRITEIRQLIKERVSASFEEILRGRISRQEAIVSFLAILELVKQQAIAVTQKGRFMPIRIERTPWGSKIETP